MAEDTFLGERGPKSCMTSFARLVFGGRKLRVHILLWLMIGLMTYSARTSLKLPQGIVVAGGFYFLALLMAVSAYRHKEKREGLSWRMEYMLVVLSTAYGVFVGGILFNMVVSAEGTIMVLVNLVVLAVGGIAGFFLATSLLEWDSEDREEFYDELNG